MSEEKSEKIMEMFKHYIFGKTTESPTALKQYEYLYECFGQAFLQGLETRIGELEELYSGHDNALLTIRSMIRGEMQCEISKDFNKLVDLLANILETKGWNIDAESVRGLRRKPESPKKPIEEEIKRIAIEELKFYEEHGYFSFWSDKLKQQRITESKRYDVKEVAKEMYSQGIEMGKKLQKSIYAEEIVQDLDALFASGFEDSFYYSLYNKWEERAGE